MDLALLNNYWVTEEELGAMIDADKKNILMTNLNRWYDGEVHTLIDLSIRDISADKGSLCGMAGVYQALENTILTKSELKKMSYEQGRDKMTQEMIRDVKTDKKLTDVQILTEYHKCIK